MSKTGQHNLKWPKITKKYAKLRNKMGKQWVKMTKIEQKWAEMTKKCIKLSKNEETMGNYLVKGPKLSKHGSLDGGSSEKKDNN